MWFSRLLHLRDQTYKLKPMFRSLRQTGPLLCLPVQPTPHQLSGEIPVLPPHCSGQLWAASRIGAMMEQNCAKPNKWTGQLWGAGLVPRFGGGGTGAMLCIRFPRKMSTKCSSLLESNDWLQLVVNTCIINVHSKCYPHLHFYMQGIVGFVLF